MKGFGKFARGVAFAGATAGLMITTVVQAANTIKVAVLRSLSGTMAISETTLKDTILWLVDDLNQQGGLFCLGGISPVVIQTLSS
jgi:urea transport system substrate-binding protein